MTAGGSWLTQRFWNSCLFNLTPSLTLTLSCNSSCSISIYKTIVHLKKINPLRDQLTESRSISDVQFQCRQDGEISHQAMKTFGGHVRVVAVSVCELELSRGRAAVLWLFKVTAGFYSRRPAPSLHCKNSGWASANYFCVFLVWPCGAKLLLTLTV